jgi:hypothetical protein
MKRARYGAQGPNSENERKIMNPDLNNRPATGRVVGDCHVMHVTTKKLKFLTDSE